MNCASLLSCVLSVDIEMSDQFSLSEFCEFKKQNCRKLIPSYLLWFGILLVIFRPAEITEELVM